jgi:hypothetical protein
MSPQRGCIYAGTLEQALYDQSDSSRAGFWLLFMQAHVPTKRVLQANISKTMIPQSVNSLCKLRSRDSTLEACGLQSWEQSSGQLD